MSLEAPNSKMEKARIPAVDLMDRRAFLLHGGMAAAGTAFAYSLMGCQTVEIELPCLSVVPAPTPVPGMTYIRASQIGCALDCDLRSGKSKHGRGEATDDAPKINAAMAAASAAQPMTLIIDGSALISGLFMPAGGNWSIAGLGCGTGFFIKSGTNNDGIHNGAADAAVPTNPGPPAPARGANVTLSNFTVNGNQGNGFDGDSSSGEPQGKNDYLWYFSINLMNLNHIVVENVVVVNSPSFHFRFSNVGNVKVSGCVMRSVGLNTDGLHFDGPANDIEISNCEITTDDDGIALNCPEGYTGDISRVTVTNCTFQSLSMMRLFTIANGFSCRIDSVSVSNCAGSCNVAGFTLGDGTGAQSQSVTNVTVSDCSLTAPCVFDISANFGDLVLKNLILTPKNLALTPAGVVNSPGFAFIRSTDVTDGKETYIGSSVTLENCSVADVGKAQVAGLILDNGSSIAAVHFAGFASQAQELVDILSGSIGELILDAVTATSIQAPVSPGGFAGIVSVSGSGVLATGWQFPDAVMANNVPYISATTGEPSIKVAGVVEPYPEP